MAEMSSINLALLSYLGVNGRAFDQLETYKDPRTLIDLCYMRKPKRLSDEELEAKIKRGEQYRVPLEEFEKRGGKIVGAAACELGTLRRAPRPPLCAYVRGNPALLSKSPKVAIIGTRNPSPKGETRAIDLARSLSREGVTIGSGGANGVDLAAHRGAVAQGCETLSVLGDPLRPMQDERPTRLRNLNNKGLLTTLTLFGPWVRPSKALFVARNQFVAALADAVVIIEGRLNSGTLHTARFAQEMNIPVWTIPGDPENELASAGNFLLEQVL